MQPEGMQQQAIDGMPTQAMVVQSKSSLPVVIGVLFCIAEVLVIVMGLMLLLGGAILGGIGAGAGEGGDSLLLGGGIIAALGVLTVIIGAVGIWAGVKIAQRKKIGVHVAWGLIGASVILSVVASVLGETGIDYANLGCNGICALLVGLPLMVASASQHME